MTIRRVALLIAVCLTGAATAWAANPSAPTVTSGAASGLTPTSATLTGTVTSPDTTATVAFQYGTADTYGLTSTTQTATASTTPQTVTAVVTGLTSNTGYHYRVTATNPAGTATGSDKTFTTAIAPFAPAVGTGAATGVTTSGATLNGTVRPNGLDTSYVFEYGTSTAYGTATPSAGVGAGASNVSVKQPISGLKTSTTYHYRVTAVNAKGTVHGSDHTFKTKAGAPRPAVATSGASNVNPGGATLNGKVNPEGSATTYVFQYGQSTKYGATTAAKSVGSGKSTVSVSAPVSGLQSHTTYHFRIVATSAAGVSAGGDHSFYTATGKLGVVFSVHPDPVVYGHTIALSGQVTGAGAGVPVTLRGAPFPFSTPLAPIGGPTYTNANGGFRFIVANATVRTGYQAVAVVNGTTLTSATVTSRVRVRVGLTVSHLGGRLVRFAGTVKPGLSGSHVSLQRRRTIHGRWIRVAAPRLMAPSKPGGARRFAVRLRLGRKASFRAVVIPNGGGYTRGVSRIRSIRP